MVGHQQDPFFAHLLVARNVTHMLQEDFQHPFSIWQSAAYTGDKLSENLALSI